jgi:hypothetical protein
MVGSNPFLLASGSSMIASLSSMSLRRSGYRAPVVYGHMPITSYATGR